MKHPKTFGVLTALLVLGAVVANLKWERSSSDPDGLRDALGALDELKTLTGNDGSSAVGTSNVKENAVGTLVPDQDTRKKTQDVLTIVTIQLGHLLDYYDVWGPELTCYSLGRLDSDIFTLYVLRDSMPQHAEKPVRELHERSRWMQGYCQPKLTQSAKKDEKDGKVMGFKDNDNLLTQLETIRRLVSNIRTILGVKPQ